jgi:hypothetical protein
VDSQHKLLLAVEVTQDGNDTQQLMPMLENAQEILQSEHLIGLADSGYFSGEQLKLANEKGIEIYVPIPKKNGSAGKEGRFTRDRFTYDAENDDYRCPQGERIARCGQLRQQGNRRVWVYKSKASVCKNCPLQGQRLNENATYKSLNAGSMRP